jgi:predicted alpha/beta-hydrolase family hydrolase
VLVVQGERDAFGTPDDVRAVAGPHVTVVPVPDADHALRPRKASGRSEAQSVGFAVDTAADWLQQQVSA